MFICSEISLSSYVELFVEVHGNVHYISGSIHEEVNTGYNDWSKAVSLEAFMIVTYWLDAKFYWELNILNCVDQSES